jgi:hypothetical protein
MNSFFWIEKHNYEKILPVTLIIIEYLSKMIEIKQKRKTPLDGKALRSACGDDARMHQCCLVGLTRGYIWIKKLSVPSKENLMTI